MPAQSGRTKPKRETLTACDTDSLERVLKVLEAEAEGTLRPSNDIDDAEGFGLRWARYAGACFLIDRVRGQLNKRSHDAERQAKR